MKHMASNFAMLDEFEGVDLRRWQKKMHFLLSSMSVVYVLTTHILEDGENATIEQIRKRNKWENDDYVCRGFLESHIYMAEDASSKKFLVSNFTNYKMTDSRPVMEQYNELLDFKHTLKHQKEELTLVELGSHLRIEESLKVQDNDKPKGNNALGPLVVNMMENNNSFRIEKVEMLATKPMDDDVAWWVDSGATVHVCKDRCSFKTYESLNDGSILHMRNESTTLVHGRGCVDLRFSFGNIVFLFNVLHVPNTRKNLVSSSILNNCGYKQVTESNKFVLSKHDMFIGFGYLSNLMYKLNIVNDNIDKFKVFKTEVELQQGSLIKRFRTDRGGEYMDTMYFQSVGIIHEPTTPYTLQQNGISERKNRVLKEMVNSMLSYLGLSQGFWGEAMLTACCRAVVRLPDPNLKTLGERGIECIFVGYVEYSKAFRFYVIEPTESVLINSIVESKDAIFNENRLSLVPRPRQRSLINGTEDIGGSVVREMVTEEEDPKTFDEAMKSQDVAFWKEVINDEMDSIMGNNTWVLADLPLGCKPLSFKWIFKRKLKVDGTIKKFKARLVIQGFKQKSRINYFDTYALVACISTIRLLIALTLIHSLVIHQMDVKTTFLNGELDEEVYMNQHQGFIMPDNENKVCKLIKSLYGLK
ncbi:zinc finger, CCHC-type containing protein [Tanacetum coccineum]|uniref:Zinc finger, CCHC-type containing protein n=1 Tax=Tanacetum coccineum TaxID=301880 RepID=A0ABQ5H8N9_9ASTR